MTPGVGRPAEQPLRVAAAQATSLLGDVEANVATAVALVVSAAHRGARVVVLPEAFLSGYDPGGATGRGRVTGDDERLRPLARARPEVVVLAGTAWQHPDGRATLALLEVRDGAVRHVYDKRHVDVDEAGTFVAGPDAAALVEVDGHRLGLGICRDASAAAHVAQAAAAGATAYVVSAAWFAGSEARRDATHAARARESGLPLVVSSATGPSADGRRTCGGSGVFGPDGETLAQVGDDDPAVVVWEI